MRNFGKIHTSWRPLFLVGGLISLSLLASLLFPSLRALAGPEDYKNLQYTVTGGTVTVQNPPADGSATFQLGPGLTNMTIFFGTKTIALPPAPPLVDDLQCPMDAIVLSGGVARYYRFEQGTGQGMGQFNILNNGCGGKLKVTAGYGGITGKVALAADAAEEEEEVKNIDACEDVALLGGLLCAPLTGAAGLIQGLYEGVIAYASFSLYAPVAGDKVGKAGVNEATYSKLKSTWQIFARLASLLVVAAFLAMIIASSAAGKS